jgi:hypothetical protein
VAKRVFSGSAGGVIGQGTVDVETLVRGSLFKKLVDDGWSFDAAWQRVGTVHVDYTDVTRADINIKAFVPFWSYMSRSVPRELEMISRGGYLGRQIDDNRRRSVARGDGVPDFAHSVVADLGNGYSLNVETFNPATQVINLFNGGLTKAPQNTATTVFDGLHPLLSGLVKLGQQQYRGKPFGFGDYLLSAAPTLRTIEGVVPTLVPENDFVRRNLPGLYQTTKDSKLPATGSLAAAVFGVTIRGYGR